MRTLTDCCVDAPPFSITFGVLLADLCEVCCHLVKFATNKVNLLNYNQGNRMKEKRKYNQWVGYQEPSAFVAQPIDFPIN